MSFSDPQAPAASTRPEPPEVARPHVETPSEQVIYEVLVAHAAAAQQMLGDHERLVELVGKLTQPAQMETVVLTPQTPTWESRERVQDPVLSIGVFNPNDLRVYFSGVGSAAANMRSPSAPPNSLIVLPLAYSQIEVAVAPADLGADTAVVFLFRYFTVQPAFLGKGV